jgi:hypothetical protein
MRRKVSKAQVPLFLDAVVDPPVAAVAPGALESKARFDQLAAESRKPVVEIPAGPDWRTSSAAPARTVVIVEPPIVFDPPLGAVAEAAMATVCAELLEFEPRHLSSLPLSTTLLVQREGGALAMVTTSRASYQAAHGCRCPVFAGGEVDPLCLAAENDRGTPSEFERWCRLKLKDTQFRLTANEVCRELGQRIEPKHWVLGDVLWAYGLQLVAVYCDEVPRGLRRASDGALEGAA